MVILSTNEKNNLSHENFTARFRQSLLNGKSAGIADEVEGRFLDPHGVSILSIKLCLVWA